MDVRDALQEGFDYDLWANQRWLGAIPELPFGPRAKEILTHSLRAQNIWLERCISEEEVKPLSDNLSEEAVRLCEAWKELIRICDPGAFVSYTNSRGESFFNTIEHIARHVINHGTYHRGQLRGLAEAAGTDGFPETDMILFIRDRDA